MKFTELFIYKPLFMFELLIAMHLFSFHLPKKKNYIIRYIISILSCLVLSILFPLFDNVSYSWWFSSLMFIVLYLIAFISLFFVYDVPWHKLFFISIASYTSQHLSHELYALIARLFNLNNSSSLGFYGSNEISFDSSIQIIQIMSYLEIHLLVYIVIYFLFGKKIKNDEIKINNKSLMLISSLILFTNIVLSSVITYLDMNYNKIYFIIVGIYNILSCLMVLYIQFYIIDNKKLKGELQLTSQLLHQSEIRYEESKKNVNLINLKCHDLKHQIRKLSNKEEFSKETVKEITDIINIYDSNMQTNNEVIDIILAEKSLLCQKDNIKLTCLADCSKLNFILDADLYCLFGNILDNAIEAVYKLKNNEKRQINIVIKNVYSLISITVENYYEGDIVLDKNGLPITTKDNKDFHGFGMKSIKMIVDKYHGDMNITKRNDIFSLNILFTSNKIEN